MIDILEGETTENRHSHNQLFGQFFLMNKSVFLEEGSDQ